MTVALIDDHKLLLETITVSIQNRHPDWLVHSFNSFKEFQEKVRNTDTIDILILDLIMPDISGIKVLSTHRSAIPPDTKIIILSSIQDVQSLRNCIRMGALGFLPKNVSLDELLEAIETVQNNEKYIGVSLRKHLLDSIFTEEQIVFHLSGREQQVLEQICKGFTIKEIAFAMNLSAHTVQYYHRNVMQKLKVSRTSDLIVFAIQHGLYNPNH